MEPEGVVYDEKGDIFYNDKYLEILKVKDYVLDIDKKDVSKYEFLDEIIFKKNEQIKLDTHQKKESYIKNIKIKNLLIQLFNRLIVINKYLTFGGENQRVICINYIIKKFTNQRLINKNIYVLYFSSKYIEHHHVNHKGTLIDPFSYTLYKNAKNNNIYNWITHDDKIKYKSSVTNINNNTNYYLVNNDISGDVILDNNFDLFKKKNKNIKFDFLEIFFQPHYENYKNNLDNNYLIFSLYLIMMCANKGCQILFAGNINDNIVNNFIRILHKYFKKTLLIHPKYLHVTTNDQYILFDHFNGNFDKKDIEKIKHITSNNKMFDMNLYLYKFIKTQDITLTKKVHAFLEKLSEKKTKILRIYYKLIPFLYDERYNKMTQIIMYNIKKKQIAYANNKSNIIYLKY